MVRRTAGRLASHSTIAELCLWRMTSGTLCGGSAGNGDPLVHLIFRLPSCSLGRPGGETPQRLQPVRETGLHRARRNVQGRSNLVDGQVFEVMEKDYFAARWRQLVQQRRELIPEMIGVNRRVGVGDAVG